MPTAVITILSHDEVDGNGFHPHFPSGTFLIGLNVKVRLGVNYEEIFFFSRKRQILGNATR